MGIQGLIPLLKEAHTTTHIQDYAGLTLAVDAYVSRHAAPSTFPDSLLLFFPGLAPSGRVRLRPGARHRSTHSQVRPITSQLRIIAHIQRRYLNYALEKIRMLRHYDVVPYIVFDGAALPSKLGTEVEREKRRNEALAKGNAFLAAGNATQAREAFVKAVDVTPAMAYQLIKVCTPSRAASDSR